MGELAQLITSFATLIGVVAGIFLSLRQGKKLAKVEMHTNGMLSKIEASATAKGVTQGHAEAAANRDKT